MRRAADALLDDIDEIAELLSAEQGKPRAESYTMELLPTVDALHWCAKQGPKILADEKIPMTSEEQYGIVVELIEDAVAAGATKRCGGPIDPPGLEAGRYIAPTVLTGVTHEMRIMREEIFGPVLPIVVVDSEQEAIDLANDSEFGLGASVWTKDRQRGARIARRIESGMVWVNDHSFSHGACQCAWGGVKDSGLGRSHSKFGFYECVNIKTNAWEPGLIRDFWWHPYDQALGDAVRASARILYGKGELRARALREGAGPLLELGRRT